MLWNYWWNLVGDLRSACARTRTFLWMALCLAGMSTRKELLGVTSIVRALGLEPACYDRLLDFFHSHALELNKLTPAWCALVFRAHPGILRVNSRPILVGDGIKVAKTGRKMPGVKKLLNTPSPTPSRSLSSATPARRSPCSPKPCPAYSPCFSPVAFTKARSFPTAIKEPCWTR